MANPDYKVKRRQAVLTITNPDYNVKMRQAVLTTIVSRVYDKGRQSVLVITNPYYNVKGRQVVLTKTKQSVKRKRTIPATNNQEQSIKKAKLALPITNPD